MVLEQYFTFWKSSHLNSPSNDLLAGESSLEGSGIDEYNTIHGGIMNFNAKLATLVKKYHKTFQLRTYVMINFRRL